jgi:hypothetical protein
MLYLNDYEIAVAVTRFERHPVLGPAARFLNQFRNEVNAHSDGWAYWRQPVRAAAKLMTMIQHPEQEPTEAALTAALSPIKAFYTRHGNHAGMDYPSGWRVISE